MSELKQQRVYRKLPARQQRVLQVLALHGGRMSAGELVDTLKRCGWGKARTKSGVVTQALLKDELRGLLEMGLVCVPSSTIHYVWIDAQIEDFVVQQSLADGHFEPVLDVLQGPSKASRRGNWYSGPRLDMQTARRQARVAFYRGDVEAYASACRQLGLARPASDTLGLMQPLSRQLLASLPLELQAEVLEGALRRSLITASGSAAVQAVDACRELVEQQAELLGPLWINRLVAAGSLAELQQWAEADVSLSPLAAGCTAFLTGQFEIAETKLEYAAKQRRKESEKRNLVLPILPGLMQLLLLLRKRDTKSRRRLKAMCDAAKGQWPKELHPIADLIKFAAGYAEKLNATSRTRLQDGILLQARQPELLGVALAAHLQHWFQLDTPVDLADHLDKASADYAELGFAWLAGLCEDGALVSSKKPRSSAEAGQCHQALGTFEMLTWIDQPPLWQNKLEAMRLLVEGGSSNHQPALTDPGYDERMIWELDLRVRQRSWNASLRPFIQKRSASGWTKGRPVALERLYAEAGRKQLPFLSDQDREICKCIEESVVSTGYYRYTETIYNINISDALLALVGHPLVFAPGDRSEPLQIESRQPELVIRRQDKGYHVTIEPAPRQDRTLEVFQEGGRHVVVVSYTPRQLELAALIEGGLRVPAEAEGQVLQMAKTVAGLLAVQSDVAMQVSPERDQAAEAVAADPRPYLHLLPCQQGVRAECFVRPFGEQGPSMTPGVGGEHVFALISGRSLAARRDLQSERQRVGEIVAACPSLGLDGNGGLTAMEFPDADEALQLLCELEPLRRQDQLVVYWPQGQTLRLAGSADGRQLRLQVKRQRDWFAASGDLAVDDQTQLDLAQLIDLVSATPSRFVPLSDGRFLALSNQLRRRLDDLASYGERRGNQLRFPPVRAAALDDLDQWCQLKADKDWKDCLKRIRQASDIVAEVPSTLQAELRDYQVDGFRWLCRMAHWGVGACLADDMGLGKTLQAIALLLERAADGPALVIAPTSVCFNWEQELHRFAPSLNPRLMGTGDRTAALDSLGPRDVVITSYGLLHNETERLAAIHWHTAILDEAQAIKNTLTKRSQAAMALQADFRLILTGTPIENHLGELWNLFRFINPGLLGSLEQFQQRFAVPIQRDQDRGAKDRLKRLIQPFVLRRTKTQVLSELPPRIEINMPVTLSEDEAKLYEAARRRAVNQLAKTQGADGSQHLKILAEIMRLRRACCHPSLLVPDCGLPGAKLAAFSETIDELLDNQHKALVFSQFVDHLAILREELQRKGIAYQYLDGSTPAAQRRRRVEAFQNGQGDVFLISLKAGGTGLNLTAADFVLHMDPWWNPAVEDQAADRAHRIGQRRPVTIYRFVTRDTIEEKIVELHATKRDLADSLLEGTDSSGKLSAEQLLALLR